MNRNKKDIKFKNFFKKFTDLKELGKNARSARTLRRH